MFVLFVLFVPVAVKVQMYFVCKHICSAGVGLYLRNCKRVVIRLRDPELTLSPGDTSMCFCDSYVLCGVV